MRFLQTQSDASYCTRSHGRSVAVGIAYPGNSDPMEINGPIMVKSSVIKNVMASIGEAEYAAAFHTAQMATRLRKTLSDLGYPQPPTYILVDNKVAHGIASSTIEPKRTKSIDMQYHWLCDRVQLQEFLIIWRKGMYYLADFFTKPLSVKDHQFVMHLLVRVPSTSPIRAPRRALGFKLTKEPNQVFVGSSSFVLVDCDLNQIKTFNFLNLIAVLNTIDFIQSVLCVTIQSRTSI